MAVTNDPTGRVSRCEHCGERIEEARLMKGMRDRHLDAQGRIVTTSSPGILVWRRVDQGHASVVCDADPAPVRRHKPGRITYVSVKAGRSNVRKR